MSRSRLIISNAVLSAGSTPMLVSTSAKSLSIVEADPDNRHT